MKIIRACSICFLIFYTPVFGISQFGELSIIYDSKTLVNEIATADLDGDNHHEIIVASKDQLILLALKGKDKYEDQILHEKLDAIFHQVHTVDLDGDGDLDVVSVGEGDGHIAWYENKGGLVFSEQNLIFTAKGHAISINSGDLDGDGDSDIVAAYGDHFSSTQDKIGWFENLGDGKFDEERILDNQIRKADEIALFDIDEDSDLDLFIPSLISNEIFWLENLGSGKFSRTMKIESYDSGGPQCLSVCDVHNDGKFELIVANRNAPTKAITQYTFEVEDKDGEVEKKFGEQLLIASLPMYQVPDFTIADFNNDEYMDICLVDDLGGRVGWLRNTQTGFYSNFKALDSQSKGASSICAADIDGDGDTEIIFGAKHAKYVGIFNNETVK